MCLNIPWGKPNTVGGQEGRVPPAGFGAEPQIAK
jgi:hypothetical protein